MDSIKKIVQSVAEAFKGRRDILITISSDEFLEIANDLGLNTYKTSAQIKNLAGLGGNIISYSYMGHRIHFKIDTELKNGNS